MATLLLPRPFPDLSSSSSSRSLPRRSPYRLLPLAAAAAAAARIRLLRPAPPPRTRCKGFPVAFLESFDLPSDYFAQLPRDLRLDLNDAAFDLSNGPVVDECGEELGDILLNWLKSWEQADTLTSRTLASKLPLLERALWVCHEPHDHAFGDLALGRRLSSAGRRFQSMGPYGQGELAKIAKIMIATGKHLAATQVSAAMVEEPKKEARTFKFGELQVEVTSDKPTLGLILSWQLAQGVQSIPESSLQYANDNALLLAKSLRGGLLATGYSSAILSTIASFGVLVLARQLKSENK
ncbi:hypothetical protein ACJRO7_032588 [Eucalyptus globulus]|uniref:Uncharacterized protein n=1 Tax=Eucalyptus globulus TaxID=34317 RepID=A0ABD3JR64_EUCGL